MEQKPGPQDQSPSDDFAAQIRDAETALSRTRTEAVKSEAAKPPPFPWKASVQTVLLLASMVVIYFNWPDFVAVKFSQKPLRAGPYTTDKKTDACILNLWAIAAALREGTAPAPRTCPASKLPYIVEKGKVRCPNPQLHKAAKLYADKKNIVPFLHK